MNVKLNEKSISRHPGWLESDKEYIVVAIRSDKHKGTKYLLWAGTQNGVALFQANSFEILDAGLSSGWVASLNLNGYVELSLPEWLEPDFWEQYFDIEKEAITRFEQGMLRLTEEL